MSLSTSGPCRSLELPFVSAEGLPEEGRRQEGRDGSTPGQSHREKGLGALADNYRNWRASPPRFSACCPFGGLSVAFVKVGRPLMCYIRFNNVIGFPLVSC